MKRKGGFTLSLDCEGLWGMADQSSVVSSGAIHHASLSAAYDFIARTLQVHQVHCSAAFVTAFAAGAELTRENLPLVREIAAIVPDWFAHALPALEKGNYDGWDGQVFFRRFAQDGHEIAWHGATHLPLESATPDAAVQLELRLGASLLANMSCQPQSVVFPRNRVGHLEILKQAGFETYRSERRSSKLAGLAREWAIFDKRVGEVPRRQGDWFVSPPGDFLNWPARVRAAIPPSVTIMRWKSLLRAAAEKQGYVHMWFHPHNLITAPAMKHSFTAIIEEVARLVRSGDLIVLTIGRSQPPLCHAKHGSAGMTLDVLIEPYSEADLEPLRVLFSSYFPPGDRLLTPEYNRWLFDENPFGKALMVKVLEGQRWVGFMAMVPVTLTKVGQDLAAYYVVNVLVHPDFHGKHLFGRMIKAAMVRVEQTKAALLGHPNDLALKSWQRARMHFHDTLRPSLALPRPWVWTCRVHTVASASELAPLAKPLQAILQSSPVWRVAATPDYLAWRFLRHPSTRYCIQLVFWREQLVGVQVSKTIKRGVHLLIDQFLPAEAVASATGKLPLATACFLPDKVTREAGSGKHAVSLKKRIPFFLTRPAEPADALATALIGLSPSDF